MAYYKDYNSKYYSNEIHKKLKAATTRLLQHRRRNADTKHIEIEILELKQQKAKEDLKEAISKYRETRATLKEELEEYRKEV